LEKDGKKKNSVAKHVQAADEKMNKKGSAKEGKF